MTTPLEEAVERREQWLVEQLAGAWEWTEEMVRNALDKDCPRLNALSIDEERVASMRNTIILILDANYHTAISKAQSTADQIVQSIVGEG
jgi:phosphoglycerate-specific signal transduction histidine kinase